MRKNKNIFLKFDNYFITFTNIPIQALNNINILYNNNMNTSM